VRKVILVYNAMWGGPLDHPPTATPCGYMLTTDRDAMSEAAAVVFHLPELSPAAFGQVPAKQRGQLWVGWFQECEAHYPYLSDARFMRRFDLTMSYRLGSDVPVPYVDPAYAGALRKTALVKEEGKLVNAFVSSPFNASGRIEFLTQLMAHLDVHSYGKLFRNRKLDGDQGRPSKLDTIGKYKFTLAFENAIAEDYVTEKFYDPLLAGSVPVYLGAPNIDAFAPGDNCFINVADWSSAKALADYLLEVARDEVLYASFFAWKDEPFRAGFSRLLELTEERPFARLCKTIDERSRSAPPARWRWLERLRPSNRGTR
jgi:hypothetical protein